MREIVFRGKRIDNGEWISGDLRHWRSGKVGIHNDALRFTEVVIPETVGQYTGLKDVNGRRIFEGDILQGDDYPFFHAPSNTRNYFAEVIWFENSPAFGLFTHKNPQSIVAGISNGNCDYMEDFEESHWEVIGNIHDNPGLLKEGAI